MHTPNDYRVSPFQELYLNNAQENFKTTHYRQEVL